MFIATFDPPIGGDKSGSNDSFMSKLKQCDNEIQAIQANSEKEIIALRTRCDIKRIFRCLIFGVRPLPNFCVLFAAFFCEDLSLDSGKVIIIELILTLKN